MIKVFLQDWLYNAGIVGFLKINRHLWDVKDKKVISNNEDLLKIKDNYIEFDTKIFDGFAKRFFDYAFNQYGRYENLIKLFNGYIDDLKSLDSEENFQSLKNKYFKNKELSIEEIQKQLLSEISNRFKKILQGFTLLKKKLGKIPTKNEIKKDKNLLIKLLEKAVGIMKKNKEEFWESDVQIYLRKIYGQKSFLNRAINKDRFEKFFNEFEEPLKNGSVEEDRRYYCISCMKRQAKKNTIFDTGLSKFYGLNPDAINFVWNFNPKLPLCEICEIVYFSYFAGLTSLNKNGKTFFYFVNSDSSVEELLRQNLLFEKVLTADISENLLLNFFTQLILEAEHQHAVYTLQNISVIELDLANENMPKVYSFNLSKSKAKFLKDEKNKELLKRLSRTYYKIKEDKFSVLPETVEKIVNSNLNYSYLNKLTKIFISNENGSKHYETNIKPYHLQSLNIIVGKFLSKSRGEIDMHVPEKDLWQIYYKGLELSKELRRKNAENKIQSISYKLLNALRVGNINQFMDVLVRTYMAYGEEIPSSFVKAVSDQEAFYSLGYSFLNGLLGKDNKEGSNNE